MWIFTKTVFVNGKKYAEGDTIGEKDISPGHFASLKRLGDLVPYTAAAPDVPAVEEKPAAPIEHKRKHK